MVVEIKESANITEWLQSSQICHYSIIEQKYINFTYKNTEYIDKSREYGKEIRR